MSKPITVLERKPVETELVEREYTYEELLELFPDGGESIVNPLVRRCQEYEAEIERLQNENRRMRAEQIALLHDENGRELPPYAKGTLKCPALGTMEYENGTARPLPTPAQKRTLSDIQTEQLLWSERNFGNHPAWHPLLGIQEEAGELAHAFLKRTQGIRKNQDHDAAIRDAVGDIVIYLMDFCSCEGIDLQEAIEGAWDTVRKRNWKAAPTSGMEAKQ